MSFQNFDRAFQAFSSSSIFTLQESMKADAQKLMNGHMLFDLTGVSSERVKGGFKEKVLSIECTGGFQDISELIKEITVNRNGSMTVVDFTEFTSVSENLLGEMTSYSTLVLTDKPGQVYLSLHDGKTGRAATCVVVEEKNRVGAMIFAKVPN